MRVIQNFYSSSGMTQWLPIAGLQRVSTMTLTTLSQIPPKGGNFVVIPRYQSVRHLEKKLVMRLVSKFHSGSGTTLLLQRKIMGSIELYQLEHEHRFDSQRFYTK